MIQADKRDSQRVYERVAVTISVIPDERFKMNRGPVREVTSEISEKGLRFYDEQGLPEGAMVEIFIEPPDAVSPITHYGRVRWVTPAADRPGFDMGVELLDASPEDRGAWLAYVRRRINSAAAP